MRKYFSAYSPSVEVSGSLQTLQYIRRFEGPRPAQSLGAPGLGLGFTFKQIGAYVPIRFR
jgi:hypothetical protein